MVFGYDNALDQLNNETKSWQILVLPNIKKRELELKTQLKKKKKRDAQLKKAIKDLIAKEMTLLQIEIAQELAKQCVKI